MGVAFVFHVTFYQELEHKVEFGEPSEKGYVLLLNTFEVDLVSTNSQTEAPKNA